MTKDAIDHTLAAVRDDRQLAYENLQSLHAVQALCGAITPNMIAVSMACVGATVHLHFYLGQDASALDAEQIEDVASELSSLQVTVIEIRTHVNVVGTAGVSQRGFEGRGLFIRHGVDQPVSTGRSVDDVVLTLGAPPQHVIEKLFEIEATQCVSLAGLAFTVDPLARVLAETFAGGVDFCGLIMEGSVRFTLFVEAADSPAGESSATRLRVRPHGASRRDHALGDLLRHAARSKGPLT